MGKRSVAYHPNVTGISERPRNAINVAATLFTLKTKPLPGYPQDIAEVS